MPAPTHLFDLMHAKLLIAYPSTPNTLQDLMDAHYQDHPTAWGVNAMAWYAGQGIVTTGKSLIDVMYEYWT